MNLHRRSLIAAAVAAMTISALPARAQEDQTAEGMPEGKILPDIVLGQEDAPVTIIEYASFTCNHCAAFHDQNLPRLKAEYIDTGKVRFIQRDVYFDAVGLWAGILARCGGDDKYYTVAGMIFDQQRTWLSTSDANGIAANLRKIGTAAGFSNEQMDACWDDRQKVADLIATFQKNASADEVEGTPSFIIAGEKVKNEPWPTMKKIIDSKLAEAESKG